MVMCIDSFILVTSCSNVDMSFIYQYALDIKSDRGSLCLYMGSVYILLL